MEDITLDGLYENIVNYFDNINVDFYERQEWEEMNDIKYTFSKVDVEELKVFKDSKYDWSINVPSYLVKIRKAKNQDDKKYISLNFREYTQLKSCYGIYPSGKFSEITILIYEDFSMVCCTSSGKYYPLQLSSIAKKCNDSIIKGCIALIFDYFSNKHLLFNDICKDYKKGEANIPIDINLIWDSYNKYDLLNNRYKNINIPKSINKYSIQKGYLFLKLQKYIDVNYHNSFLKWFKDFDLEELYSSKTIKDKIITIFTYYYMDNLNNNEDFDYYIVNDYVNMLLMDKQKINLKIKSYNRLKEEHDVLMIKTRAKQLDKIKIPKNTKFKRLKLPNDFEKITSTKRIVQESEIQKNCVSSYIDSINRDNCAIYSLLYDEDRYTIEIKKKNNLYYWVQIAGFANSQPPREVVEYVEDAIDKVHKKKELK